MTPKNSINMEFDCDLDNIPFLIIKKQLELLYTKNHKALYITLINSIVLSVIIFNSVPLGRLLSWQGSMITVICLRFMIIWFFHQEKDVGKRPQIWINLYMLGTGVTGAVWGITAILFFPDLSSLQQTFMIMLIAGMMAAASAFQSIMYRCFIAYIIPLVLPYLYILFMSSADEMYLNMGLMTTLYVFTMLVVAKRINRVIIDSIKTQFENRDLICRLKESESKFRVLTESTASGIFILQDDKFRYINKAGVEITGYELKDLENKPFWSIIHPEFRALVIQRAQARLNPIGSHRSPRRYEFKFIRKDGIERWIDFTGSLFMYQGRKSILGTAFDITERKQFQKELILSERRYRKLFNSANDAIFVIDVKEDQSPGRFLDVNDLACKWLGYIRQELLLMNLDDIDCKESRIIRKNLQDHMLAKGQGVFEGVFFTKNGNQISVEISAHLLHFEGRTIMMCIARDITQRKVLMEKLTEMASTDSLTGAFNRRHFLTKANEELTRAKRYNHSLVLLMIDIDKFKDINDTYGHQAGDKILNFMVDLCKESLRQNDIFGRLGGDEFAALLVESGAKAGLEAAERLRKSLAKLEIKEIKENKQTLAFTVSIGLAVMTSDDKEMVDLMLRADKALYVSKKSGRNRVENA